MKLATVLLIFTRIFVLSCYSNASTPAKPTSNNGVTIESRSTELASKQQPSTSYTSKSDDELEIYSE